MAPHFVYRFLAILVSAFPIRFRRLLWRHLVMLGQNYWPPDSAAQRIPGGMYVKRGVHIRPSEGQAMRFIGAHTPLPIPVVVDNLVLEGETWLVMSRLPGYNLGANYLEITPQVEQHLSRQLARILPPLRALPAPTAAVCGFDQGPIYSTRLAFGSPPIGPFGSVDAFHRFLIDRAGSFNIPEGEAELVQETIRRAHSRAYRTCLTHNDLGPHNVLVDENWNITGIVDWESCGWMPEYWELTNGTFLPQYRKGRWFRIMSSAFPQYTDELQAERYIVMYRGCYT
ncbi:kinase-like protein [Trametes meyenii]|nr:kinase-like protein [Trametes meyenii]